MASSSSSSAPKNGDDDFDIKLTGVSLEETPQSLPTPVSIRKTQEAIAATQAVIVVLQTEILVEWELKSCGGADLYFEESDVEEQIDRVVQKISDVNIQVNTVENLAISDELRSAISEAQNDIVKHQDYIVDLQHNILGHISILRAPRPPRVVAAPECAIADAAKDVDKADDEDDQK
ncbi:hypothetical protein ACLB2K_036427 [Fragaria x ananassa]